MDEGSGPTRVDRRRYLKGVAGVGVTGSLAGCFGGSASGQLSVSVADESDAIEGLSECTIRMVGFWIKSADQLPANPSVPGDGVIEQGEDDISRSGSRDPIRFGDPKTVDLVDGEGVLATQRLPAGAYEFLQLQISGIEAVAGGGGPDTVVAPAKIGTTGVIQLDLPFEIVEGERTEFVAGIRPVRTGNRYTLYPVADSTRVR